MVQLLGITACILALLSSGECGTDIVTAGRGVTVETVEIDIVVFGDYLLHNTELQFTDLVISALPYHQNEVLQEVYLLDIQLFLVDIERVHGDGLLFGVGDVLAAKVLTESFVGVSRIDHDDIGAGLMELAYHTVHMKRLTATRWAQTKEVTVVSELVGSFLAGDVNGYWYTLTVGIVDLQRGVLALLETFLVHQTGCRITQSEEAVVLVTHCIAVAGERVGKELQLVESLLGDMDADTAEDILYVIGGLLWINIFLTSDNEVVMGIDELLVLTGNHVLNLLDVLDGNEIAGTRHTGMTVLLGLQLRELLLLVGDIDHLIEDDGFRLGDAIDNGHQVNRHRGVVDLNVGIGAYLAGDSGRVYIYERIDLGPLVTHADALVINL